MTAQHDDREALLDVQGVSHTYAGKVPYRAIERVDFQVREHEIVSIVGPSGAGKTTVLKILSGLMAASEGTVRLDGTMVHGVPRELAMVFQDYSLSLYPWMTVWRNTIFPLLDSDLDATQRDHLVAEALAFVGLKTSAKKYPWQLSGGMQQRVAIARALAYRPRLLLMDEPFASVDAQTRQGLEDLVLTVRNEMGMTILLVTHDIDEAVYLSDRVVVLSKSPASVVEVIDVNLGTEREQIETRTNPIFIDARKKVASLIQKTGTA